MNAERKKDSCDIQKLKVTEQVRKNNRGQPRERWSHRLRERVLESETRDPVVR
jgi:sarcosine oxidase delta subunit